LDYLQGMKGFDEALSTPSLASNSSGNATMQKATSIEEIEKMGFQTKRQVKTQITKQLGIETPEKVKELNAKFKEAKTKVDNTKGQVNKARASLKELGFKPNPLKGLPLKERIEKSLNWQVNKSISSKPAMFETNASIGFKHTPKLTYSAVLGATLGLGYNWQNIRFSNEGLRIGANMDWKCIWGISAQTGVERLHKKYQQPSIQLQGDQTVNQVISKTHTYYDIAYTGIQKTYKLNSKYKGTMLLAYDWLWKQGNGKSPIIWRVGWKK
jgi:hypothetical protein